MKLNLFLFINIIPQFGQRIINIRNPKLDKMKSSTKKLDKLLGNKPKPVSTKNSITLSPHVTYGVTSPVTTAASSTHKKNSRNFAMTYAFLVLIFL